MALVVNGHTIPTDWDNIIVNGNSNIDVVILNNTEVWRKYKGFNFIGDGIATMDTFTSGVYTVNEDSLQVRFSSIYDPVEGTIDKDASGNLVLGSYCRFRPLFQDVYEYKVSSANTITLRIGGVLSPGSVVYSRATGRFTSTMTAPEGRLVTNSAGGLAMQYYGNYVVKSYLVTTPR